MATQALRPVSPWQCHSHDENSDLPRGISGQEGVQQVCLIPVSVFGQPVFPVSEWPEDVMHMYDHAGQARQDMQQ